MAINLEKGQRVSIQLPKFVIGLGWDANETSTGQEFDLDASAFILNSSGKMISDEYFVFYNNLKSPDGAVCHTGDNRTGQGDGDDEKIEIDLSKINPQADSIAIIVTIHDAETRRQNFGQVRNSFIRIYDASNNEEMLKYELEEDFSIETAVEFGRIYKKNNEWRFEAVGSGQKGGLQEYLQKYN